MKKRRVACIVAVLLIAGALELQAAVPNLVGTYIGTGKGAGIEHGYYNLTYTVIISDQKGSLFRGKITFGTPMGTFSQKFTGFIDTDFSITANYRESSGEKVTEALSWGKYIAPTAKQPKAGYQGHWINAFSQDSGTMALLKN
jgi:hypothetical protein